MRTLQPDHIEAPGGLWPTSTGGGVAYKSEETSPVRTGALIAPASDNETMRRGNWRASNASEQDTKRHVQGTALRWAD